MDRLFDARELLVKNPGRYARHVRGVAGLSILGDGSVAVNLDLAPAARAGQLATVVARASATVAHRAVSCRAC